MTTVVNRMLARSADTAFAAAHAGELADFTDLRSAHWAWYEILEATNSHNYIQQGGEIWTSLR